MTLVVHIFPNMPRCSVKLKTTWKLMKPHVPAIVGYFVFPMLCFSDDDAEMWEDDPVEYIRNKTDPMEDFKSPQHAAANLLMTLVRDRPTAMPQVLEVVSAAAQSYAQDQSEAMARRKDGALNMLSTVLDLLMEDEASMRGNRWPCALFLTNFWRSAG